MTIVETVTIGSLLIAVFILLYLQLTAEKFTGIVEYPNHITTYQGRNRVQLTDVYGNRTFDNNPDYDTPNLNTVVENSVAVRDPYLNIYVDDSPLYTDVNGNTWWKDTMDTSNQILG